VSYFQKLFAGTPSLSPPGPGGDKRGSNRQSNPLPLEPKFVDQRSHLWARRTRRNSRNHGTVVAPANSGAMGMRRREPKSIQARNSSDASDIRALIVTWRRAAGERAGFICLSLSKVGLLSSCGVRQIRLESCLVPPLPVGRELRNRDGRQDSDDSHHHQKFDKGKTRGLVSSSLPFCFDFGRLTFPFFHTIGQKWPHFSLSLKIVAAVETIFCNSARMHK